MLRTRVITALILAPCMIAAIYLLPTQWLAVVLWLVACAGAWEWAGLAGANRRGRLAFVALVTVLATLLVLNPAEQTTWLLLVAFVWALAAVAVLCFPASGRWVARPAVVLLLGAILLPGVMVGLIVVHRLPQGAHWMLFGLLICWAADIGAYFAGKAFGRHKLAAQVSPGKTWEGAFGGLLFALSVCAAILFIAGEFNLLWLPVLVGLVAVSVLGDLFESLLKRAGGIKDSGTLLPGHGGVLDRIDSVLAVAPVFALWMLHRATLAV